MPTDGNAHNLRKRSVAAIELEDGSGRRNTIQIEDLSEADRALAEKFGYNPVRIFRFIAPRELPSITLSVLSQCNNKQCPNAAIRPM